jgi:hypothetical protein
MVMTDPIAFVTDHLGRTEARLGERLVGMIETWPPAQHSALDTVRAVYQIYLPIDGAVPAKRPASSMIRARRGLLLWLAVWFIEAGPHCAWIYGPITDQALRETDAAAA